MDWERESEIETLGFTTRTDADLKRKRFSRPSQDNSQVLGYVDTGQHFNPSFLDHQRREGQLWQNPRLGKPEAWPPELLERNQLKLRAFRV